MYCPHLSCFQVLPCALHTDAVYQTSPELIATTAIHPLVFNIGETRVDVNMRLRTHSKDGELWSSLWGSSAVAAAMLISTQVGLQGMSVLEIGCGTGLVSVGAALAGAQSIVLTDCVAEALPLALCNASTASKNTQALVSARVLNFNNECPSEFVNSFDLVCGADVLYIGRVVSSVVALAWKALRAGGALLITDPGRGYTEDLVSRAEDIGFTVSIQRDMRNIQTAVCRMAACSVVVCIKPEMSQSLRTCVDSFELFLSQLSDEGAQKGGRCDYIFRPTESGS